MLTQYCISTQLLWRPHTVLIFNPFGAICRQFPHKAFWTEADALVWDGVRFLLNGCRPYARVKSRVDDSATVPAFSNSASGRDYTTVGSSSTSAPAAKSYSDL